MLYHRGSLVFSRQPPFRFHLDVRWSSLKLEEELREIEP